MSVTVAGRIVLINETKQITDSFRKREFVLEVAENPEYPEMLMMEMIQDKCNVLEAYSVGDMVKVELNLKGRSWTSSTGETKYFNTLQAWKIEKAAVSNEPQNYKNEPQNETIGDDDDGLPF